jgi:hypothetical protein
VRAPTGTEVALLIVGGTIGALLTAYLNAPDATAEVAEVTLATISRAEPAGGPSTQPAPARLGERNQEAEDASVQGPPRDEPPSEAAAEDVVRRLRAYVLTMPDMEGGLSLSPTRPIPMSTAG